MLLPAFFLLQSHCYVPQKLTRDEEEEEEMGRMGSSGGEDPDVNVPSFFRCPISLDVMKSPVSLCTGVTYDRSSIQAWLDTGHNTCPATMQVLPTTDFVPNHTLHRLIQLWSSQSPLHHHQNRHCLPQPHKPTLPCSPRDLLTRLQSSGDQPPLLLLRKLVEVAEDAARVRELAEEAGCVPALHGILVREGLGLEEMEAAVRALYPVLLCRREGGAEVDGSLAGSGTISSLLEVLRRGCLESRTAAARVLEVIASSGAEPKILIAETDGVLAEVLRLVSSDEEREEEEEEEEEEEGRNPKRPVDRRGVDAGLSCLVAISSPRRVRPRVVRAGAVGALGKLLARASTTASEAEKALKVMETASTCTEGRAAICEDAGAVGAVVGRMMKVTGAGREHAVVVLWSVCHLFRDRRAQEAVAASNGLTKILLLMQSNCSPAARQMSADLLRIFRVDSKSCLPSYDSKTTHIAPF